MTQPPVFAVEPIQKQLDIRPLFPTPVVIVPLSNAAALSAALKARILARAETTPSVAKSNLGGWQSDVDFLDWSGEAGAAMIGAAQKLAELVTAVHDGGTLERRAIPWRINAWANVNKAGDANEMHTHAGAYWSGAYYVDDGYEGATPETAGGQFEILDPRGVLPIMYAPSVKMAIRGCTTAGLSEYIVPRSGHLILFPAWLFHGVRPYRGNGIRMSVAFNLCV